MTAKLQKCVIHDWTWYCQLPEDIEELFQDPAIFANKSTIKTNKLRSVYCVEDLRGVPYIVKHDHPAKGLFSIKNIIKSKVKAEYLAAKQLEQYGLPVAEYLGYAQRGIEGMLVSKKVQHAVDAKAFWFSECLEKNDKHTGFLDSLAFFLKRFFKSPFYHPDLHLGNLLYQPDTKKFFIVDPYGIKNCRPSKKQFFKMFRIIGALRGELTDTEANQLIKDCNMDKVFADTSSLWYDIMKAEAEKMVKVWPKRRKQILSGKSKYCVTIKRNVDTFILRISQGSKFYIDEHELDKRHQLERVECCLAEAQKQWLQSFFYDFQRFHHKKPVLWEVTKTGQNILFYDPATNHNRLPVEDLERRKQKVLQDYDGLFK